MDEHYTYEEDPDDDDDDMEDWSKMYRHWQVEVPDEAAAAKREADALEAERIETERAAAKREEEEAEAARLAFLKAKESEKKRKNDDDLEASAKVSDEHCTTQVTH